jgi:hypothetical protein
MVNHEKLLSKMSMADQRLGEMFEEVGQMVVKRRVSQMFGHALQRALQDYAKASLAVVKAQGKQLAQLAKRTNKIQRAIQSRKSNIVHVRGHHMTLAGPTHNFQKVYVSFPDAKAGGPQGEWLWARTINRTIAKIDNIPFFCPHVALGDLVRVNKEGKVTKILEHVARTRLLQYADPQKQTDRQILKRYVALQEKLEEYDIVTEPMGLGMCSASVPNDLDDSQLALLAEQAGAQVLGAENGKQGPQQGITES